MNYEKYIALLKVKKIALFYWFCYWRLIIKKFQILEEKNRNF